MVEAVTVTASPLPSVRGASSQQPREVGVAGYPVFQDLEAQPPSAPFLSRHPHLLTCGRARFCRAGLSRWGQAL